MPGYGENLTPNQSKALAALLSHATIQDAAADAGLNERTVRKYLEEEGFHRAYIEARSQMVSQAVAGIQASGGEALAALRGVLHSPSTPASSRVAAARTILEYSIKGVELEDIRARLEDLEADRREEHPYG